MIKLIIADDEKWVRTTVKTLIPFQSLGISLACEAANGIEALELCRQHEPDILVTDIMMPGLNGLELIREVRHLLPDLKIVIISGYNDFEYAKTAIKFGITDYLLKPVDEEELLQVLERIRTEIGEKARLNKVMEAGEEQVKKALPVMCEAFLNELISRNSMTAEKIKSELKKYNIDMPDNIYTICVTAPDEELKQDIGRNNDDQYRILVKRTMKHYAGAVTFPLAQDKNILVSIINKNNNKAGIDKAFRICNLILGKKLNRSISTGISNPTHQPGMLPDIYMKACEALESRFWEGSGTLATYRPGTMADDKIMTLPEETLNKITLNLKLSNIQTAVSYAEGICNSMKNEQNMKPAIVKEFFWQFLQSVIIMLNIQLPFIRHETMVTGVHPYERIKDTLFISSLEACIKELLQKIFNFYHDKNPIDNNNLAENAKKIIEKNFAGDISLEQVAKYVHLSPAYLSELFKKETGMSFIDYKTIIRIEHAKKLLCTPSMNISEISGKVGYSDPKYFSKLFKKITGKTIFEYRKEIRNMPTG
jgi:two-component system, response regulator YesN